MSDYLNLSLLRSNESKFKLGMKYLEEDFKKRFNINAEDSQLEVLAKLDPTYKCATNVWVIKQKNFNGDIE